MWLTAEQEIPDAAPDEPGAPACSTNQFLDLSQWARECGVFDAEANRHR
jgi:hypothetical protein